MTSMANTDLDATHNLSTFRDAGVLRLSEVLNPADISSVRSHFWEEVDRLFDIRLEDPESWFANPYNPVGGSRAKRLSGMNPVMDALRDADRFRPIEAAIQCEIDALFGAGRWEPLDRWYSLLTFPGTETEWTVPHNSWHNDEPIVVGDHKPWSIFVFVFLDTVDRDTGPTIAVSGSHRRGELIAPDKGVSNEREVRAFDHANSGLFPEPAELKLLPVGQLLPELVATDDWFADLVSGEVDDHRTQRLTDQGTTFQTKEGNAVNNNVVCLSADVGDIVLFDPRSLHSVSSNISDRPRQVLRIDFRRTVH